MRRSRWPGVLPWALVAVLLGWNLWKGSLLSSDDAIYAQAAREALETGRRLDVTWQGRPLFEKGPVLFWALEAMMFLLGPTDLAARLPGVLAGLLLLLAAHRVGTRLGATTLEAWTGPLLLLTTNLLFFNARRPMTDVPGAALALWGLVRFLDGSRRGTLLAGLLIGAAALTKLVAPAAVILALVVLQGDRRFRAPGRFAATLAVATLTALPWHLAMVLRHGKPFWDTYVGFHLLHRAAESVVGPGGEVYWDWILEREGPAGILAILTLVGATVLAVQGQPLARLAIALVLGGALPLLVSRTALPHYLVALLPGLGLTATSTAMAIREGRFLEGPRRAFGPWASWIARFLIVSAILTIFLATNARDLQNPDYSPDSRTLCEDPSIRSHEVLATVDLHDPALVWYCDRPLRFLALDPAFHEATRSIPMLQGVAVPATPRGLREIASRGGLLITIPERLPLLTRAVGSIGLRTRIERTLPHRIVVSLVDSTEGPPSSEGPWAEDDESNDPTEGTYP